MNILFTISYLGTQYCGWQRQPNGISVQETIETALEKFFAVPVPLTGASRTDAGVHAIAQKAVCVLPVTSIPTVKLPLVLNRHLPQDILITAAEEVPQTFHPRYDATDKTYEYKIKNAAYRSPLDQNQTWHIRQPLQITKMQQAALHFIGEHDFAGFCSTGGSAKTTIRTIYSCDVSTKDNDLLVITVTGNGFLYNMVRILAGTLVDVGLQKKQPEQIPGILQSKQRNQAGKTAPAHGLLLTQINYKPKN